MAAAALLRRGLCRTASAAARAPARTAAARAPQTQARWARPLATTPATLSPGEDLGSFDYGFTKDRIDKGGAGDAAFVDAVLSEAVIKTAQVLAGAEGRWGRGEGARPPRLGLRGPRGGGPQAAPQDGGGGHGDFGRRARPTQLPFSGGLAALPARPFVRARLLAGVLDLLEPAFLVFGIRLETRITLAQCAPLRVTDPSDASPDGSY